MLTLPRRLRLTPLQFAKVCAANPEAVLELDADGHLIERSPTGGDASSRNSNLIFLLELAVHRSGLPLKVFECSGGFLLPDGSVRSPRRQPGLVTPTREPCCGGVEGRRWGEWKGSATDQRGNEARRGPAVPRPGD